MKEYEQDWNLDEVFYKINPNGKVIQINIETWNIFECEIG